MCANIAILFVEMKYNLLNSRALAEVVADLRSATLKGDEDLFPYRNAQIEIQTLNISHLVPLAKYVMLEQLEFLENLQSKIADKGNIFALNGQLLLKGEGDKFRLSPPVVEYWPNEGLLLVDGLHRVWLALKQRVTEIVCFTIQDVEYPLVPLPAEWEEIVVIPKGKIPKESEKRNFRFESPEQLRPHLPSPHAPVTKENYRYYFFRNLEMLGSAGIRK